MTNNKEPGELDRLRKKIENNEGTLEELEAWLLRLQTSERGFKEYDEVFGLRDALKERRRLQGLRERIGTPLNRERLIALVQSIDYSRARSGEEIEDLDARSRLFADSVPYPHADRLIERVWCSRDRTAEEVVDEALAWKVPDAFYLPGAVDPNWAADNERKNEPA